MSFDKAKPGLILLGAKEFPRSKNFGGSEAFYNSYKKIRDYFTSKDTIGIEDHELLDLFNSDESPDEHDTRIAAYITERVKNNNVSDLIIYYTGHGGYAPQNGGYILATKSSRDDNLGVSSITLKNLSITISKCARNIRTYLILDCCFAGDAVMSFQSDNVEILKKQIDDDFPSKGISLLCSSSKDLPSIIVKERNITMFSEGLEMALRNGNKFSSNPYLTFRELHQLVLSHLKDLNPGEFVRPEIHTPKMPQGDIADIPLFPNKAKKNPYDIQARKKAFESKIVSNDLVGACKLFMDFIVDFDTTKKYEMEMILTAAECNGLEEEKTSGALNRESYQSDRKKLYIKMMTIVKDLMTV